MVVDADLGMPLELGRDDDRYWTGNTHCASRPTARSR